MSDRLLIKGGTVIDPVDNSVLKKDILCEGNKIIEIAEGIVDTDCKVIDATGKYVAPGLVDVHVHFRDPGFEYKEDILTGAKAAARGGFTSVVLMANTSPAVDNEDTVKYIIDKGAKTDINVYTCGTVTMGMAGETMVDMDKLMDARVVGFTDDGKPIMDEELVKNAMLKVAELNVPISFHEENPAFITNNGVNKGKASEHYNIGGSPRDAEIDLIKRDLEIALETGASINIQHISSKEGVELVRMAKERSMQLIKAGKLKANEECNVHAEATPHHFSLTEEAVIKYGTNAKMNPPLREESDRQAILEGLKDGTIDLIATDHAPHSAEEKAQDITKAPSGIIGLETALPLAITHLIKPGVLSLPELIRKMSYNPAKLYHLNAGTINVGDIADMIIFDIDEKQVFTEYASKSSNTPFTGVEMDGVIKYTVCQGKIIYTC